MFLFLVCFPENHTELHCVFFFNWRCMVPVWVCVALFHPEVLRVSEVDDAGEGVDEVELDLSEVSSVLASLPGVAGEAEVRPSFSRFFCFMRRFWNQIFTWVSFSWRAAAISTRLARVRYLLKWNSFSSSVSCLVVKLVLTVLGWPAKPYSPAFPKPVRIDHKNKWISQRGFEGNNVSIAYKFRSGFHAPKN